jgi:alpha-2-macroglobulin
MIKRRCKTSSLLILFFTLGLGIAVPLNFQLKQGGSGPMPKKQDSADWNGNFQDGWRQVDALIGDQKFEAASALLEKMLSSARDARSNGEWTRCLVRYTQLRIALHGYETAVRYLKEQPWPSDPTSASVLNLFYANALTTYAHSYSWEINRREKTESKGVLDLKAWTRDQIYEEAQKAFENVWKERSRLGDLPAGQLKDYITPNTYPAGVRPTMRDSVSYMRVEMLADTNGWKPEQLNETYRLRLKDLLKGSIGDISIIDPASHPLQKISYILADLKNWHTQRKEAEAALEATLELYRQLHQHFTQAEDKQALQDALEKELTSYTGVPWWAEGMAQLAEFIRGENEPESLVRARQVAIKGQTAFPDSHGGRHCLSIRKSIETPDYSITGMQNDNPSKKSLLVEHKNLEKVYFRAYSIDFLKTLETSNDYNLLPSGRELETIVSNTSPALNWEVQIPATPDFRMHKTFATPPMKNPGVYLVVSSGRPAFNKDDNQLHALYMTIGDLVLITKQAASNVEVSVVSGSMGKPVSGVEVMLYRLDWNKKHQRVQSVLSDEHGMARLQGETTGRAHVVVAAKGKELTYNPQQLYFSAEPRPAETGATLLFTDRSIYRPLQTLHWKAVAYTRKADGIRFETASASTMTVYLRDLNNQVVDSKTVTTNSFGTASGEFAIPAGRTLGLWRLESSRNGQTAVRVEEYKRPTFEAKLVDPAEPLRLNKPAHMKGEAKYYFGLPVTNGQVKWTVRREPVFPWWWSWWEGNLFISSGSQQIASGLAALKEDGTFTFTFSPEADERLRKNKELSYRYSISADVTDEGGETRSAQRSFRLGFVSIEARASLEKSFFLTGERVEISVLRTSLDGSPKAGRGTWHIAELKGPAQTLLPAEQPLFIPEEFKEKTGYKTSGDEERPRWNPNYNPEAVLMQWPAGATKSSGSLEHNERGEGKITVPHLEPGAYRLVYETVDEFGTTCQSRRNFIVASPSLRLPIPAVFMAEKSSVGIGETARILVHSGLKDQFAIFEVYRDGKSIQRKEIYAGADSSIVQIPITEKDRGGLGISLTLVRDNQFIRLQSSLMVPWDNKELKLEFSTFRDRLRPGQQETWRVKVSGPTEKDIAVPAAELLAYMYDRSLDAFAPHFPASPLGLYPYRAYAAGAQANLQAAQQQWLDSRGFSTGPGIPALIKDNLLVYRNYGIGGVGRGSGGGIAGGSVSYLAASPQAAASRRLESAAISSMDQATVNEVREKKEDKPLADAKGPDTGATELRSNFSESAFWYPHLLTDADGTVTFEFKVPDSVTAWNVWVHAITRDLKGGSISRQAQSVKELMVRPYLPRFLREGDQAELKVVVNNASDKELKGALKFDIIDTDTEQSILSQFGLAKSDAEGKAFTVPGGGGANLTFPIVTPSKIGQIAFKVTATSGDFSDGELRPIPILPGRMHLMQSRFVTLKDDSKRVIRFEDLAQNNDPTRINEQMVVTLDAQLFYSVLSALPYLVNYPYECTEQTLNRFVSTGILSSLYTQYPAVERMAKEFSSRQTQLEQWDAADPNRKMALEETPWLQMAKGGDTKPSDMINVLDSRIAKAQRESALAKLKQAQTSSGGFPWFSGGPPSPYMTLYLLHGFSKALEFGVDVPREMVQPAWSYMHRHYLDDIVGEMMAHDSGWEFVTFINYVLSNYPDGKWYENSFTPAERKTMLDFSFKHWREHSPYLKGYLALTLKRMDRSKDAMLVWSSVLDSAKTAEDQGTFWAPEDRGWLWYNDTIETHAFAIRTDMELIPNDPKLDGMVLWIFLNKKMNHWKSTRATAEVIYSLAHYLKKTEQLGVRESATVAVGNQRTSFVFEPDQYTGKKNQVIIPGEKMDPQTASSISVEKTGKGHMFASATWHFSTEQLPEEERGDYLRVSRSYFKRANTGREFVLQPINEGGSLETGDEVEVHLSITSKHPMEYVHLRDPRAAGFEPTTNLSRHKWDLGISWYEEIRDSGTNFYFEHLPQGEYTFKYRIRATTAGAFKVAPATIQPMYAPEFTAYSSGAILRISK